MCINRCRLQSVSSRATVSRSVWRGRCHRLLACVVTLRERRPWTNPCTNPCTNRGRHHRSLRQAARTPTAQSCLGNRDAYTRSLFNIPYSLRHMCVCTRNTRTEMSHSPQGTTLEPPIQYITRNNQDYTEDAKSNNMAICWRL